MKKETPLVYVCSPCRGYAYATQEENLKLAKVYAKAVILAGAIPQVPHLYWGGGDAPLLNDENKKERELALKLGISLLARCDRVLVFPGRKMYVSEGMLGEIKAAQKMRKRVDIASSSLSLLPVEKLNAWVQQYVKM